LTARCRGGEKHLVCGTAAPFAGRRKNAGLGRSVYVRRGSSPASRRADDTRCSSGAEEGNDVGPRPKMRGQPTRGRRNALAPGDASFARSGGPCTSIVAQLAAGNRRGVTRSLWHRGRANLGNWEEPAPGLWRTGVARLDACRRSSQGGSAVREKRKTVAAVVPSRSRESGSKCSHVVAVAEVGRRRLASNTLVRSAPKRVAVRVNGGLARGHRRR
jgi:hypothetical protein